MNINPDNYSPEKYNVTWYSPSKNSSGSMPLGNGDIGINAWFEESGKLYFYIGKTDSWSETAQLLKLGLVEISFAPCIYMPVELFRQTLNIREGSIEIFASKQDSHETLIKLVVDANNPAIYVDIASNKEIECEVKLKLWRNKDRKLCLHDMWEGRGNKLPDDLYDDIKYKRKDLTPVASRDIVIQGNELFPGSIAWYHRNKYSTWYDELHHQGLDEALEKLKDPLINLTFGGIIKGEGYFNVDDTTIKSINPSSKHAIEVCLLTMQTDELREWINNLKKIVTGISEKPKEIRVIEHINWWKNFWGRSHISIEGEKPPETYAISQTWHIHRFMTACAGRGNFPIKFNGSIFNVDGWRIDSNSGAKEYYTADYREWGGCFWNQNQRQVYWPMLAAGDFEFMIPFFKMYLDALPFSREMTRIWFGHEGAFFPETMHFWGSYSIVDYGLTPAWKKSDISLVENNYVRWHWQGGLEVTMMMLDYYDYTQDKDFAKNVLLPVSRDVVLFYDLHYKRDKNEKIRFEPAQALETLWNVVNPLPETAGLKAVLTRLISLPEDIILPDEKERWVRMLNEIPAFPFKKDEKGNEYLDACEENRGGEPKNAENVAMYAVFPYRIFGISKPGLETLTYTYYNRPFQGKYNCWHNDNVFAAYLGITDEARKKLAERCNSLNGYRCPGFFANGDWVPDVDNGGVIQQTIQAMLMQADGKKILLFPSWPREWDVDFKLYAPFNTIVECVYKNGKIINFKVEPKDREKDIEFCVKEIQPKLIAK